jgi:AraC-like DNA-binding protein
MSITPNEIVTMREPVARASGRVLTLGLGLGYYAYMVHLKEDVTDVTVVEREQAVIDLFEKKPPGFELLCKARLTELLSLILAQFETGRRDETGSGSGELAMVRDYIDSSYLQPITLDSLGKQFHINKFTLTRNFRQLYGKSVIHYYRSLRADYAKKLLTATNRSVSSIGEELGFSDIYSFSRFFHAFPGMSPTAYRDSRDDTKEV